MKVPIQLRSGGPVHYESLFNLVRADGYSMRWDYDDQQEFTAALTEVALDYARSGLPAERMTESTRAEAMQVATNCAAWTWEHFAEQPSYRPPAPESGTSVND